MFLILIIILIITGFFVLLFSKNEKISDKLKKTKILIPFYKAGALIYRRTIGKGDNFYYRKVFDKNSLIYAAKENNQITEDYFIEKTTICFLLIFTGMIFALVSSINSQGDENIQEGNLITKNAYNQGEKTIFLNAEIEADKLENMEITVPEVKLSEEEFYELMPEYTEKLEMMFLDKNESFDYINKSVNLTDSIDDYPFVVEWDLDNKKYINSSGEIADDIPKSGVLVNVIAKISYESYSNDYLFTIHVFPKELSKEEYLISKINGLLEKEQEENKEEEYFKLPNEVDGIQIKWTEEKSSKAIIFALLVIIAAIGIFFGKDLDLDKQIQNRNNQMLDDYAEIIGKMTLLVGAGMTIEGAWKKIVFDYLKKKSEAGGSARYAYEEMTYTMYEMESGIEETICYQHFASRVKNQKYVKFISLLEQNLKMGTKGLIADMKREAADAFNERKNQAEKKGDEASTKLLLPMFMMLIIVMVIIMIPAFMTM